VVNPTLSTRTMPNRLDYAHCTAAPVGTASIARPKNSPDALRILLTDRRDG
jgi:hypothetical protein